MRNFRTSRRGATAVEFALVLPLVVIFVFGLIEWGRFEMVRQVSSTAAFQAARIGSLPGATEEETQQAAQSILQTYFVSGATVNVTLNDSETVVGVSIPMNQNSFVLGGFLSDSTIEREFALQIF